MVSLLMDNFTIPFNMVIVKKTGKAHHTKILILKSLLNAKLLKAKHSF